MAESDFQRKPLTYAVEALDIYFQDRPDVYVSGNLFLYYREGGPRAVVAPDVFVVFSAVKRDRPSYKLSVPPFSGAGCPVPTPSPQALPPSGAAGCSALATGGVGCGSRAGGLPSPPVTGMRGG